MDKFKIFMGTYNNPADEEANEWCEKHDVTVLDFKYQQCEKFQHSICIRYREYLSNE